MEGVGQAKHTLVVDENADVRDVIVAMLQKGHYRVSAASGCSEMRDFLETDTVDCASMSSCRERQGLHWHISRNIIFRV